MAARAIVHLDIDCFYIQCELLRRPNADPARPAAATQKFLVVTCNSVSYTHLTLPTILLV